MKAAKARSPNKPIQRLWKGRRNELEARLVERVASGSSQERISVFIALDLVFEEIADEATERLKVAREYA